MDILFTILGNIGVICFLAAFFLLQKERLKHDDYAYLLLNAAGAALLIASLLWEWNLSAFMLECAWLAISLYGIYKRATGHKPPTADPA
jgi:hypothetical protein